MKRLILLPILAATAAASAAPAPHAKVLEGPQPKWVLPVPQAQASEPPKDVPLQIRFLDTQVRVSRKGQEQYIAQRLKILRPEALKAANLQFVWRPSSGKLTVHSVRLHRSDGSVSEMLGKTQFQIVQREENLEQSSLTGLSTAVFAIPGVDIGDEIEFAATITNRDQTLGDDAFGALQLPLIEIGGAFRARLIQTDGMAVKRRVTSDLDKQPFVGTNTADEIVVEIDNPKSANLPEGAPGRFGVARLLEFSTFDDWPAISVSFWKLFERSARLAPNSPVRAEIAKIAAAGGTEEERGLAALKLVQDRIRYVYVGLGAGNFTPASAEETWLRRYGDCKGKTALLLAILKELGIPAEPVLVNQGGLDGIRDRLASPGLFDHVLVRASINGKQYWLDGTQLSSPKLRFMPSPTFRSALPLREKGATLEDALAAPLIYPELLQLFDIDATAGIDKPARISSRRVFHDNGAAQLKAALSLLAGDDLKRAINNLMEAGSDAEVESTNWTYDGQTGALTVTWTGTQKLDWEGDAPIDKTLYIPGAGFTPPDELNRPKEQNQSAPWAVEFPNFRCWVSTIRLPAERRNVRWSYSSKPVDRVLGGVRYFRQATIQKGVVQTVMSKRSLQPELSAQEAKEIAKALPAFDNDKSYVFQQSVGADMGNTDDKRPIISHPSIDWMSAGEICMSPKDK